LPMAEREMTLCLLMALRINALYCNGLPDITSYNSIAPTHAQNFEN